MNKQCVILFGDNPALRGQVEDLLKPASGAGPTLTSNSTCVSVMSDGRYDGFMNCDIDRRPVWYERNEPYSGLPVFDARSQWKELCEFLGMPAKKKKKAMIEDRCIIKVETEELSNEVQKLAFMAGYSWEPLKRLAKEKPWKVIESGYNSMCFGDWWGEGRHNLIVQGEFGSNKRSRPDWITFDASKDMDKIKKFFAGEIKKNLTVERLIKPSLLDFIRSNHNNEMVVGFIRRDLSMCLPAEIQEKGPDAICEWIVSEKTKEFEEMNK